MTGPNRDSFRFSRLFSSGMHGVAADRLVGGSNKHACRQQLVAEVVTQDLNTRCQHSLTILVDYEFIP
ncbi:hypothetical protein TNCV_4697171 [Trichonephila clavipes]|nr:hypothetical protein TNCV_4697171 [Trichonephila clavipes]